MAQSKSSPLAAEWDAATPAGSSDLTADWEAAGSATAAPGAPARVAASRTDRTGNAVDQFILDKFGGALSKAPDIQGSMVGRFLQGLADMPVGIMQLAANTLGFYGVPGVADAANKRVAEINRTTEQQRGPDAGSFDVPRLAGNILNPAPWKAGMALPAPPKFLPRVGQSAAVGAPIAAASPVTNEEGYWGDKVIQTVSGAAVAAGIPVVGEAIKRAASAIYHGLIEPATAAGRKAIKGRELTEAAGPRAQAVISELRKPGEIVPGSQPTAGEAATAAGSAEFAAMQKTASEVLPSEYLARESAQNAARARSVGTVAQDKPALKAAESARKSTTDPMYGAARAGAAPVDTRSAVTYIDDLLAKNPGNKQLVTALKEVRDGLHSGTKKNQVARTSAQEVSSSIDNLKKLIDDKENKFIKGQLSEIKNRLIAAVPGLKQADQKFAEMSKPMNVMQVGQYLEGKLVPALNDYGATASQKAGTYAGALRDAPTTIERSTGIPRYDDLAQILSPQEREAVESVARDLARKAAFERQAAAGTKAGERTGKMASRQLERQVGTDRLPNLLDRAAMMANAALRRINGRADERLEKELAKDMLNPKTTAELMEFHASRMVAKQLLDKWRTQLYKGSVGGQGAIIQPMAREQGAPTDYIPPPPAVMAQ